MTRAQVLLVQVTGFFTLSAEVMLAVLLPLYAIELALSPAELGTVIAAGSLGPLALALPAGALCDHYGDRRLMILFGAGGVLAALAYPFAHSFAALLAVQVVGGTLRSNTWVAVQAYSVRHGDGAERQRLVGRFSFATSLGMLVGPIVVGWVMQHHGVAAGFWCLGAWVAPVVVAGLLLPEHARRGSAGNGWQAARRAYVEAPRLLLRPMLALLMVMTLLRLGAAAMNGSFYPVHLDRVGLGPALIGALLALINAGNSVGALFADGLARRIGSGAALAGSLALGSAAIALTPLFRELPPLVLFTAIHGIAQGVSLPLLLSGLARYSGANERGLVLALRSVFNRLGFFIVPLALGAMVQAWDIAVAYLVAGAALVVATAVTFRRWQVHRLAAVPGEG